MLKGNVVHTRALLQGIREEYSGIFLYDDSECNRVTPDNDINLNNIILSSDKRTPCNFFISHDTYYRDLFYVSDASADKVNTDLPRDWESVCGYCSANTYAYGINNGKLYQLIYNNGSINATQVGTLTNWTNIAGYSNSNTHYAYGIAGGKLYKISGNTTTRIGSLTTWTMVTGYTSAYGIAGGKLYSIADTTTTQISDFTGWTYFGGSLGLCNDKLCCVYLSGVNYATKQMSDSGNWTSIGGSYAISNGKLYHIKSSLGGRSLEQVGTDTTWEEVGGLSYGINNGVLYKFSIFGANVVKCLDIQKCLGIHYTGSPSQDSYKILAVCNVN